MFPAISGPNKFHAKFPGEISDVDLEFVSNKEGYVPLVSGVERLNRREARQERVFGYNPEAANAATTSQGSGSHEEYLNFITTRPDSSARRQNEMSNEVSKAELKILRQY